MTFLLPRRQPHRGRRGRPGRRSGCIAGLLSGAGRAARWLGWRLAVIAAAAAAWPVAAAGLWAYTAAWAAGWPPRRGPASQFRPSTQSHRAVFS
jgi:hypothetical protein